VKYQFGRRTPGTTCGISGMQVGEKTDHPSVYGYAKKVYDDLIDKQIRVKKYHVLSSTSGESADAIAVPNKVAREDSGICPMLLTAIDQPELQKLACNPSWCFQEKKDGERRLLRNDITGVVAINRNGEITTLLPNIEKVAEDILASFIIDGEEVGDQEFAFDLLELDGVDWRKKPMKERWLKLAGLNIPQGNAGIVVVETAFTTVAKEEMIIRAEVEKWEGIVAKMVSAPYEEGRSKKAQKFKFKASGTFLVDKQNEDKNGVKKRSVALLVHSGEGYNWQPVGNVTIPANFEIPPDGSFVEIEYLYVKGRGGSLYQPVYKGVRADIGGPFGTKAESVDTLKYRQGSTEDDEEA
jgi:bifunctional non-homologous end joining protein LigD